MSPIKLSRGERAALRKLVKLDGTCDRRRLKPAHAERFLEHGLLVQTPQRYHLTMRGQVEILRQRFRGIRRPSKGIQIDETSATLLSEKAFGHA